MKKKSINMKDLDLREFEKWGIDINLLVSSLNKTPTERVEINNDLLRFKDEAKRAREKREKNYQHH